jgi:hypothetical protein
MLKNSAWIMQRNAVLNNFCSAIEKFMWEILLRRSSINGEKVHIA